MKKILFFLLLPVYCNAQTINRAINPTGLNLSYAPGISLNNSTALTTIYLDTIPANTFTVGRKYEFDIYCSLSTPAVLLPNLTIVVSLGSGTLNIASASLIGASLTKKPFRIHVVIFALSMSSQYMYGEVFSDNTAMVMGTNYVPVNGTLAQDLTANKAVKVTAQFSSATGLATTTLYVDNVYKANF